jgi:DNA-binding CsgD family transcriptional regulator
MAAHAQGFIAHLQGSSPVKEDVARRAFDAVTAMDGAGTLPELDRLMRGFITTLGFSHVILTETTHDKTTIVAGAPPPHWWPHAIERGYPQDDIVYKAALERCASFFYSDLAALTDLTARQNLINEERREFGLREGFVSATHYPQGKHLAVVMVGAEADASDLDLRAAAKVAAMFYRISAQALIKPATAAHTPVLTARQRECLSWVRAGKSAADIGAIVGISAYTVNEHVAEACRRLQVRTRVQAVAAALDLHLIAP